MIELRRITDHMKQWYHPSSNVVPTVNLTADDLKKIAERDLILDRLSALKNGDDLWVKLNTGIFRGSIFPIRLNNWKDDGGPTVAAIVDAQIHRRMTSGGGPTIYQQTKALDQSKGWTWAERSLSMSFGGGQKAINFKEGSLYPWFFSGSVMNDASLLIDYTGDRVFSLNEAKRPLIFQDRLEQDVTLGDLVVVALNYGKGLDICMVKGFADERRLVIESVITGELDRIALEDNATDKIMRMPNTLKDTALMLKLARN